MKQLFLACLLAGFSFAQTRTSATQEGNNTFSGTNIVTGTLKLKDPYLDIRAFGGIADSGTTNNTTALDSAVAIAKLTGQTIIFPAVGTGIYSFTTKPANIGSGVCVIGLSSSGSTPGQGVTLRADYNEASEFTGFLTWDGSYSSAQGTGACLKNVTLQKGPGFSGGTGVVITGTDDNHRNSWFRGDHVVINGSGTSTWQHNLFIDGSCCTTSGGQGIRDVVFTDSWFTQASVADQYVYLKNCAQCFFVGTYVFPASGGATAGITVTGAGSGTSASNGVDFSSSKIAGNLVLDYVDTFSWCCDIGGNYSDTANSINVTVYGHVANTFVSNSTTAAFFTDIQGSIPLNGTKGIFYVGSKPTGISAGDIGASRTSTTGNFLLGSDGKAGVRRTSDGVLKLGAGGAGGPYKYAFGPIDTTPQSTEPMLKVTVGATPTVEFRKGDDSGVAPFASLTVGASGSTISDSRTLTQYRATLTTTAAASDNVSITGVTASSKCTLSPTNANAATDSTSTYISAKTTDQITVTHPANASRTWDILCTNN